MGGIYFESVNDFTLPEISTLDRTDFEIELKNISGGNITVSTRGSDVIETTETVINLVDGERVILDIYSSTEFKF